MQLPSFISHSKQSRCPHISVFSPQAARINITLVRHAARGQISCIVLCIRCVTAGSVLPSRSNAADTQRFTTGEPPRLIPSFPWKKSRSDLSWVARSGVSRCGHEEGSLWGSSGAGGVVMELDPSLTDQQSGIRAGRFQPTVSAAPLGPESWSSGPDDIAEA